MSFTSLWDEKKDQNGGAGPGAPAAQPGAPVQLSAPGTTAGQASKGETKGSTSGSGWTNLQQYVGANQGAGDAMGAKIGQDFGGVKTTADKTLGDWNTGTAKEITDGTHIGADITGGTGSFDPNNIDQGAFNAWAHSTYSGPQGVATGAGVQGQQDILGQWANNAGSGEGRKNLLGNSFARSDYSNGMKGLDSTLIGGSDAGMQSMQGIQDGAKDYTTRVGDTTKALDTQSKGAQQAVNGNNAYTANVINNVGLEGDAQVDFTGERLANANSTGDFTSSAGWKTQNQDAIAKRKALDDLINGRR